MAKKRAPLYFTVRRLVDPATGEEVGALVPKGWNDQRLMRERGYRIGDDLRISLAKPRNYKQFCVAHQLGVLCAENLDAFAGMQAHAVLKKLQADSGICCELETFDVPGLGKLQRSVPKSLAFDEMPEEEFRGFWVGICEHLIRTYWPTLSVEEVTDMAELMPRQAGVAA